MRQEQSQEQSASMAMQSRNEMKITEFFQDTQETIERDATAEEIASLQSAAQEAQKQKEIEDAKKIETAEKRATAEAKLAVLGLNAEDLKALGL